MAQLNWKKPLSGLFKTKSIGSLADTLERYVKLTRKSMEQAQKITSVSGSMSPKFNSRQCKYLADKLKLAVESAHKSVLMKFLMDVETPSTSVDKSMILEIFRLLYALSKEVESFIQACCKNAWLQAAVLLSNVEQHVLSIGFNVELCTLFFTVRDGFEGVHRAEFEGVYGAEFEDVYEAEAENVREQAALDTETLLSNLHDMKLLNETHSSSAEYLLASFLLDRLGRSMPTVEKVRRLAVGGLSARPVLDKAFLAGRPRLALEGVETKQDSGAYYSSSFYYDFRVRYGSFLYKDYTGILRFVSLPESLRRTKAVLETDDLRGSYKFSIQAPAQAPTPRPYHEPSLSAPAPASAPAPSPSPFLFPSPSLAPAPAPAPSNEPSPSVAAPAPPAPRSDHEPSVSAPAPGSSDESILSAIAPASSESSLSDIVFRSLIVKENLGKGSAGFVHKVTWLGAEFAMKTFHGPNNPDFTKEISILSGLSHPNIISLLCSKADMRKCSIVIELMDEDLFSLIHSRLEGRDQESPFTIFGAVDIMLQVAEGMRYLHESRIVHRDLKSSNVLVRRVKTPELETNYIIAKVADFGMSRTKERSMTYSNQTPNVGTTRWMAPEMIKPRYQECHVVINIQENQVGIRNQKCQGAIGNQESQEVMSNSEVKLNHPYKSDVYSFAMVCYEILAGEVPFSSCDPNDVRKMVLEGSRPELPSKCPKELESLIKRCWNPDASERPCFSDICTDLRYLKFLLLCRASPFL